MERKSKRKSCSTGGTRAGRSDRRKRRVHRPKPHPPLSKPMIRFKQLKRRKKNQSVNQVSNVLLAISISFSASAVKGNSNPVSGKQSSIPAVRSLES